ncbi:thioredoxin Y1, chloroplastic-like [Andrographis paniculata]|uniref:thioredoxin Y1, chloroplastic-like n=1 Tax=Andrographis paniculata TaxID=175694 RepID=UPI0021E8A19D|nr:thioredoxin Y1, chloroplastic-like [Andrographis paniculata]
MAMNLMAAANPRAIACGAFPASASANSKLLQFSSLQFPLGLRNQRRNPTLRRRGLSLVASSEHSASSFHELLRNSEKPVLVDFYATWCGPCQFMVPILEEVSTSMEDKLQVVTIETEKHPLIADKYEITALPTFILFKDGKPCDRFEGAMAADKFIRRIETSLKDNQ